MDRPPPRRLGANRALASIWSGKPAWHFYPFDSEGRPKRARTKDHDPDLLPYDEELMRQIVEGRA